MKTKTSLTLFDPVLLKPAVKASFTKLSPRVQWRNPVMFVVYIGSIVTTLLGLQALQARGETQAGFILAVALWLWFTVLFANFAEALAEGRRKAQAASLRSLKQSTWAKKFKEPVDKVFHGSTWLPEQAENLRKGDVVLFYTGWLSLVGKEDKRYISGEPGLGKDGAEYLVSKQVVAVGADTWGLEAIPFEKGVGVFEVHQILIPKNGIYILENIDTAELVKDKAWEFMFVLGASRITGGVQGIINPTAIR